MIMNSVLSLPSHACTPQVQSDTHRHNTTLQRMPSVLLLLLLLLLLILLVSRLAVG